MCACMVLRWMSSLPPLSLSTSSSPGSHDPALSPLCSSRGDCVSAVAPVALAQTAPPSVNARPLLFLHYQATLSLSSSHTHTHTYTHTHTHTHTFLHTHIHTLPLCRHSLSPLSPLHSPPLSFSLLRWTYSRLCKAAEDVPLPAMFVDLAAFDENTDRLAELVAGEGKQLCCYSKEGRRRCGDCQQRVAERSR